MKKERIISLGLSVAVISIGLYACGSKEAKTNQEDYGTSQQVTETRETTGSSTSEGISEGEKLIKESDCKTCHHSINKLIGPSHMDVAKKYAFTRDNVELLASKIINGGSGVWGEVPMSAHANLTPEDAKKMAQYILSMDGEKKQY